MNRPLTIIGKLEEIINETISDLNPGAIDDVLCEMSQDPDYIDEAIEYLIEKLQNIKEGE